MQVGRHAVLRASCIWRYHDGGRHHQCQMAGDGDAQCRVAVRGQRMRVTIQAAGWLRAKGVGTWSGCDRRAMMAARASTAGRSLRLRLHHGQTKACEEEQQQQAGNWAPHEQGYYYITSACDVNGRKRSCNTIVKSGTR